MSYVNLLSSAPWPSGQVGERKHIEHSEQYVRAQILQDDEFIILRKLAGELVVCVGQIAEHVPELVASPRLLMLRAVAAAIAPATAMTPQEWQDVGAYAQHLLAAQLAGMAGRVDAGILNACIAIEQSAAALAAIPPAPEEGEDPYYEARAEAEVAHQALVDTADPAVAGQLAVRAAAFAPAEPEPEEQPEEQPE